MREVIAAGEILRDDWGIGADVWSVPSFNELGRDGAINVAAAAGELVLGVLKAPFDRGRTAWSALKGAAFSVPELFFIDLRKGMLDYAPANPPRTESRRLTWLAPEYLRSKRSELAHHQIRDFLMPSGTQSESHS